MTASPILTSTLATGATLTAGTGPALSANSDTINSTNILAATSVIQDGSTTDADVLNYTSNGGAVVAPTIQNIETINFTGYGAGTGLSFLGITGNNTLNVSGTNATFTNLANNRTVNLNADFTGAVAASLLANTATDAITFALNGQGAGSSVTVGDGGGALTTETVTLNVAANSSLSGGLTLDGTTTTNLTGAGNLTLGAVTLGGSTATLSGASYTGALTYTAAAGGFTTINLGSGADQITDGGVALTLNTGAGNDTIVGGANLTVADAINGGAGADTLTLTAANATTDLDNVSGVETITLAAGATYAFTPTNLSVFDLDASAGARTIDASALAAANTLTFTGTNVDAASLILIGGAGNDVLVGGSQADTLTGNLGADTITGGVGADTINLTEATQSSDTVRFVAANGSDTITNFMAGATAGGGDVFDVQTTAALLGAAVDLNNGASTLGLNNIAADIDMTAGAGANAATVFNATGTVTAAQFVLASTAATNEFLVTNNTSYLVFAATSATATSANVYLVTDTNGVGAGYVSQVDLIGTVSFGNSTNFSGLVAANII